MKMRFARTSAILIVAAAIVSAAAGSALGEPVKPGEPGVPPAPPPPNKVIQIVDALGEPVAGATVKVPLRAVSPGPVPAPLPGGAAEPPVGIGTFKTNEGGVLSLPGDRAPAGPADIVHPDYGGA